MDRWNDSPEMDSSPTEAEQVRILLAENAALRKAGSRLARRALYVVSEYDGLHRLALAASEWAKVLGDEHGRGQELKCDESK